ncbi:MATE efflux family protein chloroplastic-like [Trifolium pratense]|uniref:Protein DETOXIFICATION n=1 Tax=Trifolium pratense TaxID=57577 RepID=A0A2K3NM21_TRIPR|nr:MATE efflux family protein chloroplastic-like [Trifolium pratense]
MVLLSLHLNHTSLLKNPNLISHSNRHLPLQFLAPSLLKNTAINSTYQCITSPKHRRFRIITACVAQNHDIIDESEDRDQISKTSQEEEVEELVEQSLWIQMKEIVLFTGPAIGLWLCGPLMSLIDTAVVGQGSSIELAALGPATVFCDYLSYSFMFLSIATSNMVATALARRDREEVQHHISVLLFVGLTCGLVMLVFTRLFGATTITAFTGPKNVHIVPAANTYVQIRGLAWPFLLVGSVAQSASLGMKDSWGPLKALAAASIINGIGDIILCRYYSYGIAGAAWATLASQVVAAYMMSQTLNEKGYNAFSFSIPSGKEFLSIFSLAAPVFVSLMLKVAFYSLLIYFATSMGTHKIAAHQVMLQIYMLCAICGEPLSQTAQSFMPEMMYGVNRSLAKDSDSVLFSALGDTCNCRPGGNIADHYLTLSFRIKMSVKDLALEKPNLSGIGWTGSKIFKFVNEWMLLLECSSIIVLKGCSGGFEPSQEYITTVGERS